MSANWGKAAVSQDWKRSIFIPIVKKDKTKECSNYQRMFKCSNVQLLTSHASKGTLKTLQARLQQFVNKELPDV